MGTVSATLIITMHSTNAQIIMTASSDTREQEASSVKNLKHASQLRHVPMENLTFSLSSRKNVKRHMTLNIFENPLLMK